MIDLSNGLYLRHYPHYLLKRVAEEITDLEDENVKMLIVTLVQELNRHNGIGIAAPQVGVLSRMIALDIKTLNAHDGDQANLEPDDFILINPVVISTGTSQEIQIERCLSFPDIVQKVERPTEINLQFTNHKHELREVELSGLSARCVLHEIDHLDGKTLADYASPWKRKRIQEKIEKYNVPNPVGFM